MKKALIIYCTVIAAFGVFLHFACNNKTIMDYSRSQFNDSSFTETDFGDYSDLYYQEAVTGGLIFSAETGLAIASYGDESFEQQLVYLEKYQYLRGAMVDTSGINGEPGYIILDGENDYIGTQAETFYIIPDNEFNIGDWDFRVLYVQDMPHYIDLVAVNQNEKKIAYLTFVDSELDFLCKGKENKDGKFMERFVKKYFKYNFRK